MAGASLTVTKTYPQMGKSLIYFTVTLDSSAKADFSDYKSVDFCYACDASSLATEAVTAYTAGGDITFTNASNAIKGIALVNF